MFQSFFILSDWMQKENTFKIQKMEWEEGKRERMRQSKYNLKFLKKKI